MSDPFISLAPRSLAQSILPFTAMGSQFGFININQQASNDPDLELRIIHDIAGYGKQLGRINDVIEVLLQLAKVGDESGQKLDAAAVRDAIEQFRSMHADIDEVKKKFDTKDRVKRRIATLQRELGELKASQRANGG
jgi:hypothetical protein